MLDVTAITPEGQPACHVNEWLDVLRSAAQRGLIAPAEAGQIEMQFLAGPLTPEGLQARVIELLRTGPAARLALDAIAPAFGPGDVIELRALSPAGGGGLSICERLDDPNGRAALEAFIRDHIGVRNLYVGCNPRRPDMAGTTQAATAGDVPTRRNVVLDFDKKDAPPVDPDWTRTVEALRTDLGPMMVLDSGNGFHVWLPIEPVSGPDVAASTAPIKAVMARLGADDLSDLPRIVRLPFTPNLPNATKRARGAAVRLALPC